MPERPNLVVILPDQHSATALGCYGNSEIDTSNIDSLAAEGVRFENAYCTQPVCTPSRSSIMTGLYPHTTGLTENDTPLRAQAQCLPELGDFDDYATAYMGKWDLGDEVFPQHGFDEWVAIEDGYTDQYTRGPESTRSSYHDYLLEQGYEPDGETFSRQFAVELPEEHTKTAFLADRAVEFIEKHREQPFILYVAPLPPHSPFSGPRDDQYDAEAVSLPPNFEHAGFDEQSLRHRAIREARSDRSEREWKELISRYWGLVSLVDDQMGRVLDAIDDTGVADNTVVTYTSDHGDMLGHQQLMEKQILFEQSIGVPLIISGPGINCDQVVSDPVSQIDLVPTLLDALGQSVPEHLQGHSLGPVLRDEAERPAESHVVVEWNGPSGAGYRKDEWPDSGSRPQPTGSLYTAESNGASASELQRAYVEPVRTVISPDGMKLNYYRDGERELYDLGADPYEMNNLAYDSDYTDTIEDLSGELFDWQIRTRDPIYLS